MKKLRKSDLLTILIITLIFVGIVTTNTITLINAMKTQTQQVGQTQIDNIRTDFENVIANAETSLIRVSSGAEQILGAGGDRAALEKYIVAQKKEQLEASNGVSFNVYIAGVGWEIIPDFDVPEDYHGSERNWYIGAIENSGDIYITEPYIDSMSGDMCYTLSMMLKDKETVVGMDFTLSDIQESVKKMSQNADSTALIVTAEGMIVGYTDMSYVGQELKKALPEYADLFNDIRSNRIEESFTTKIDGNRCTVFYSVTKNNWYMIITVNNSELYSSTTRQVVVNILISLTMLIVIIVLFLISARNRIRSAEAQQSREVFVEGIVERLKDPLADIMRTSSHGGEPGTDTQEDFGAIKASGIRMGEIMNDLSSYSSIVSGKEQRKKESKKAAKDLSGRIRIFRDIIVVLLLATTVLSSVLFYRFGRKSAESDMTMERNNYMSQLKDWEREQMTILSMFTDVIAAEPERMDNYEDAVAWMNSIASNYPSISVCYLANPYREHTVIMNNGWQPDADWKVEDRDWYRQTEKSGLGYSFSAPYYDAQTGNYCITLSKIVYGKNGEFLGIFGIDLYMDKIIEIFGNSYGAFEYVFLIDSNGDIINHPNSAYQMSAETKENVRNTPYREYYNNNSKALEPFRDYDGVKRCCLTSVEQETDFTVVLVWDWDRVYLTQLIYALIFGAIVLVIIIIIISLVNKVIRSQAAMNQKLAAAVDEATAAGKAKSDFLAQMSHEIRTPINAVIGMDEMILRENKDPAITEYARDIKSAGKTLLSLINGILDFSKLETGKMEIVPAKYETTDMIDNLMNMITDRAAKKNLALNLEIDEKLPRTLYGDDVRIRQVITNLLTNAVKYTERGSVTLTMRGEDISDSECTLYVAVKDTGIGIKEEDMQKLFESFQRLDEQRNRTIEGTGLGMSIVDGLLKLMDSRLEVRSEYGKGSCFSFRIRQSVINAAPIGVYQKHQRPEEEHKEKRNMKIQNADILIVDDTPMNLKVAKALMKKLCVVPDLASGGQACIDMVKEKHYDVILMDHMMPEMDGVETLDVLTRSNLLPADTAVIALTANAISGAREMYIEAGFKDYLSKPIDPSELEHILETYLPKEKISYE